MYMHTLRVVGLGRSYFLLSNWLYSQCQISNNRSNETVDIISIDDGTYFSDSKLYLRSATGHSCEEDFKVLSDGHDNVDILDKTGQVCPKQSGKNPLFI